MLGPMLREWPSLKAVLELGVTISGTGRRETGLERGEYDQGQYAEVRPVLAVNTAGMLVRRRVLEAVGGFDDELPMFGNDLDFGWRAASAGHRTVVVPQAVVFHAEAAHRGTRQTPLTGRHTHYQERRAALFTLLANGRPRRLPLQVVRLTLGTFVRMVGYLLVRSPGEALDDLAALVSVLRHPRHLLAARRARQAAATADPDDVRRLLPPWWLPYRHGLDFLRDLGGALGQQASDVADRRRAAKAEQDPESFAARRTQQLERARRGRADRGQRHRRPLLHQPGRGADRGVRAWSRWWPPGGRSATWPGGGLSHVTRRRRGLVEPAPRVVARAGPGHRRPGPGLPPAARAWSPPCSAGVPRPRCPSLLLLAVPGAAWGAWRFLRVVGRLVRTAGAPRWVILWGTTTYALVPVVAGAWGDGRLGCRGRRGAAAVAGARGPGLRGPGGRPALARGLAQRRPARGGHRLHAGGLAPRARPRRARRGGGVPAAAERDGRPLDLGPAGGRRGGRPGPAGAVVAAGADPRCRLRRSSWTPAGSPDLPATGWTCSLGRLGDLGAPWWLGLVVPVLAVARAAAPGHPDPGPDLLDRRGRGGASSSCCCRSSTSTCWPGPARPARASSWSCSRAPSWSRPRWAALGLVEHGMPTWRRAVAVVLAVVAATVPVAGLAWFLTAGQPELDEPLDPDIPAYMVQSSERGPEHGILEVRGSVEDGLRYTVRREDGIRLGEDEIVAHTDVDQEFDDLVAALVSRPTPDGGGGPGRRRRSSTSCCRRPPTPTSPRRSTPPAAWSRRAPRTGTPGPGRSTGRCRRPSWTGRARGCGSPCSSSRRSPSSTVLVLCLPSGQPEASMSRIRADLVLAAALPVVCVAALLVAQPRRGRTRATTYATSPS